MAPPVEYTAELHRELIAGLTIGLTQREACSRAGLAWSTWCKWRKRMRARDFFHEGVRALVEEAPRAIAAGTAANLALVRNHADGKQAKGDPRAAMYLVTRRDETEERIARRRKAKADAQLAELKLEIARRSNGLANATDEELAQLETLLSEIRRRGSAGDGTR